MTLPYSLPYSNIASKTTTEKLHKILADAYDRTTDNVQASLPTKVTLKRTIQKTRKKGALSVNPQLALANDRSLLALHIPDDLLKSWEYFDSGTGTDRILILTTDPFLDFLCEAVILCGDGNFKAAPKLLTQLYTVHVQKNGYTVSCGFALLPDKRIESKFVSSHK